MRMERTHPSIVIETICQIDSLVLAKRLKRLPHWRQYKFETLYCSPLKSLRQINSLCSRQRGSLRISNVLKRFLVFSLLIESRRVRCFQGNTSRSLSLSLFCFLIIAMMVMWKLAAVNLFSYEKGLDESHIA